MKRTMVFLAISAGGLAMLAQLANGQVRGRGGPPERAEAAREAPSAREQALAQQVRALQEQLKRIEVMLDKAQARPGAVEREGPQPRPEARGQVRDGERGPARNFGQPTTPAGPFQRGFMGRPGSREGVAPPAPLQREGAERGQPWMRGGQRTPELPRPAERRPEARPEMNRQPGPQARPGGSMADRGPLVQGREAMSRWAQSRFQQQAPFGGRFGGPQQAQPRPEVGQRQPPGPAGAQGIAAQVRLLVEDARRLLARAEQLEKQLGQSRGQEVMPQGPPRRPMAGRGR